VSKEASSNGSAAASPSTRVTWWETRLARRAASARAAALTSMPWTTVPGG
jgi:hypothetical protein